MLRLFIFFLAAIFGLLSCSQQNDAESEHGHSHDHSGPAIGASTIVVLTAEQQKSVGLQVSAPELRRVFTSLRVHGVLEVPPQNLVSIHAPLGGVVTSMTIIPGDHIRKGQTLGALENPDFIALQEDYLTTVAQLELAEAEYNRQKSLQADNVNARKNLEQAQAQAAVLRIRKRSLSERLALIGISTSQLTADNITRQVTIRSPFDGYVTAVLVNTGTAVEPNGKIVDLVDPSHIHAELQVFEREAPLLQPGQQFSLQLSGEQKTRTGHIYLVGAEIGTDKTVSVHGHLDVPDKTLRPGRTLVATIETNPHDALTVPDEAVIRSGEHAWVYVQDGSGRFRKVVVTTGAQTAGYTQVSASTLDTSSMVVVKGAQALAAH